MKNMTLRLAVALAALTVSSSAFALPKYATKEKKPCAYCHVAKAGGGKRTPGGDWYKAHNHSLVGFKDAPAKPGKPAPGKKA